MASESDDRRLVLPSTPASAGAARRACREALGAWGLDSLGPDAELLVTELVTNAVLHAGTDVEIRLVPSGAGVRIEVRDGSVGLPLIQALPTTAPPSVLSGGEDIDVIEALLSEGATTGRGLRLVEQVARAWGVRPLEAGKMVWATLGDAPAPRLFDRGDGDAAGSLPQAELAGQPVRLVAVPVRLALEAYLNMDALSREFQMLASGGGPVAAEVSAAAEEFEAFYQPRDIGRQAVRQALEQGDRLLDLSLLMPPGGPAEIRRSTAVLERLGRLSESGLLLTLAPTLELTAFRAWLAAEVERQFAGLAPRPCPFTVLPGDDAAVDDGVELSTTAQHVVESAKVRMAAAIDRDTVRRVLLGEVVTVLGAASAILNIRVEGTDWLEITDSIGMPRAVSSHWHRYPLGADLPASEVVRTGIPVVLRTREELFLRYPDFAGTPVLVDHSFVSVPLVSAGGPPTGCLTASFDTSRDFGPHALRLFAELCAAAATAESRFSAGEAVDRSERMVRAVDAAVSAAAGSDGVEGRLRAAAGSIAAVFGGWTAAFVRGVDGRPRLVSVVHAQADKAAAFGDLYRRWGPSDSLGAVMRSMVTGETVVFQVVPDALLARIATGDEHLSALKELGIGSVVMAPVCSRGNTVGAIGVANEAGIYLTDSEIAAVSALAERLSDSDNVHRRPAVTWW